MDGTKGLFNNIGYAICLYFSMTGKEKQVENEKMILVPYGDFVDGMKAMADLDNIRALIESGTAVVLNDIKPILGLEVKNNVRTDRKPYAD